MTREEAINEINKVFKPAFANYIITALTEGATVSDKEPTTKNDLGVDAVSRQAINIYIDFILNHGMGKKKSFDFIKKFVTNLPSVTPQESILDKIRAEIMELDNKVCQQFLIEDIDKEVHRTYRECINIINKYKTESEG